MTNTDKIMGTQPVRIDTNILNMVRDYKKQTGFPLQRFIEDAIVEKIDRLPAETKLKMKIIPIEDTAQ